MDTMRISQLAARTGVPATMLRYYESAGLLPAGRTSAGHRLYGEDAVDRLELIGAAKHLGLALEEIAELLGVWESGACAEVKADLRPRIAARLTAAHERAATLAAFTETLRAALAHLDTLPDRTGRCDAQCGFPTPAHHPPRAADTAPVTCSLTDGQKAARTASWHRALTGARRRDIPDGLRLTLPSERTTTIAELAAAEQQCCPFFDFRLHLDGPHLHLEVRTPAEGAAQLTELFAVAL